ncbi:MAG: helix-turn-helix transcriptional regulator [Candidatus Coatesbacteria bacterium]
MNGRAKRYESSGPFFRKLLKDPEVRFHYEQERARTKIALAVREARRRAHLTQAALARKIGSTQSVIARLESGSDTRTPTLPLLAHIAAACKGRLELGFRFKPAAKAA